MKDTCNNDYFKNIINFVFENNPLAGQMLARSSWGMKLIVGFLLFCQIPIVLVWGHDSCFEWVSCITQQVWILGKDVVMPIWGRIKHLLHSRVMNTSRPATVTVGEEHFMITASLYDGMEIFSVDVVRWALSRSFNWYVWPINCPNHSRNSFVFFKPFHYLDSSTAT